MIYACNMDTMTPDTHKRREVAELIHRAFFRKNRKNFVLQIVETERTVRTKNLFGGADFGYCRFLRVFFGSPRRWGYGDLDWSKLAYRPETMKEDGRHTTYEEIMRVCNLTRDQVVVLLRRMEKCGLIKRQKLSEWVNGKWKNEVVIQLCVEKLREMVQVADTLDGVTANQNRLTLFAKTPPEEKARLEEWKAKQRAKRLEKEEQKRREKMEKKVQTETEASEVASEETATTSDDCSGSHRSGYLPTSFLVSKAPSAAEGVVAPSSVDVVAPIHVDPKQDLQKNDPPPGEQGSLPRKKEKTEPTQGYLSPRLHDVVGRIQWLFDTVMTFNDACRLNYWLYEAPEKDRLTSERLEEYIHQRTDGAGLYATESEVKSGNTWSLQCNIHFFCQNWGPVWNDTEIRILASVARNDVDGYLSNPKQTVASLVQSALGWVALEFAAVNPVIPRDFWSSDWSTVMHYADPAARNLGQILVLAYSPSLQRELALVLERYGKTLYETLRQRADIYRALKLCDLPVDQWLAPFRREYFVPLWRDARDAYMQFECIRQRLAEKGFDDALAL